MGSAAPPSTDPLDRRGMRRMLLLFAVLGVIGILLFYFSVILGLAVLVVAEVFFLKAFRGARRSR